MEIVCLGAIAAAVELVSFEGWWMPEREVTARMQ
jgi:hypothetical protein